jgi:hypothetical protein
LDFLGFPWILSCESRLFNARLEARKLFSRAFSLALEVPERPTVLACGGQNCAWDKLNLVSDFLQEIVVRDALSSIWLHAIPALQ